MSPSFWAAGRITDRDSFVFFFAGHGKAKRTEGVAYLVVPGGRDKNDPSTPISTRDIME